jgi:hypothetical protein
VNVASSTKFWCLNKGGAAVQSKLAQSTLKAKPKDKIRA